MKNFNPAALILAAAALYAASFTADATDVSWTYGNQEISGIIYIGNDGRWAMGEITSIQNTETSAYEYRIGVQPNYYLFDFLGSAETFNSVASGVLKVNDAAGAIIDIYNETSNSAFKTAVLTAEISNSFGFIQAAKAVSNNFLSPVWLQFKTQATTTIFEQPGHTIGDTGCASLNAIAGSDCNPLTYRHLTETGVATLTGGTEMARFMAMSGDHAYSALYDIQGYGPSRGSIEWSGIAGNTITLAVPEPTTLTLFSAGLLGMLAARKKA